jgi:hypothetical protein
MINFKRALAVEFRPRRKSSFMLPTLFTSVVHLADTETCYAVETSNVLSFEQMRMRRMNIHLIWSLGRGTIGLMIERSENKSRDPSRMEAM